MGLLRKVTGKTGLRKGAKKDIFCILKKDYGTLRSVLSRKARRAGKGVGG
jgi:hypothetical protein